MACSSAPLNKAGSISATTSPLWTRELKSAFSLAIVPETCDPTWTVITALIVPVASTTSLISPRSTLAVKCCACVLRVSPNAANSPADDHDARQDQPPPFVFMYRPWNRNSTMLHSYRSASIGSSSEAFRAG